MRNIKFRVLDKEQNIIRYQNDCSPERKEAKEHYADAFAMLGYALDDLDDSFVLMQYTGLKDKNGKEIFEGDIVSGVFTWQSTDDDEDFPFEKAVVMYDEEYACFTVPCTYGKYVKHPVWQYRNFIYQCKELEVIGNIYENLELLGR